MKKFGTSLLGYDKGDVNEFVTDVKNHYSSMLDNLKNKDQEIAKLNEQIKHYKSMDDTLNSALSVAQNTSAQIRKVAKDESENIIKEAKLNASRIVNDALVKSARIEQETIQLKHKAGMIKKKLRQTLEDELAILNDSDDIDY